MQGFYQKLLRDALGGDVPIPRDLDEDALRHSERELPNTLSRMYRWLHLLDMAITPAMLRQALTPDTDSEVAEALLRYFVRRREPSDVNRDKTDLIATFLYRHPRVPGQWEQSGYGLDGALPLSPFEIALIEILADTDVPSLPEEHVQLLRRFDPLLEEVARFRDFNSLIDSGMIGRVRELKQWLDASFYHPGVLATVSAYNTAFGRKFDELFAKALNEIKSFGQALEEMGGTILTTVDGVEVTVEHVAAIEEKQLLEADYGSTLEKFRRVSKLKKELDRRPPIRRSLLTPAAQHTRAAGGAAAAAKAAKAAAPKAPVEVPVFQPPAITAHQLSAEEAKLRRVEESIRVFVRVADPKYRQVVPMRFFNLTLTGARGRCLWRRIPGREEPASRSGANPDPDGVDLGANQHRTGRTEAQPEDVVSVEAARRFCGRAARYGQHFNGRGRKRYETGRAEWRRNGRPNDSRVGAKAAESGGCRGENAGERQLDSFRLFKSQRPPKSTSALMFWFIRSEQMAQAYANTCLSQWRGE